MQGSRQRHSSASSMLRDQCPRLPLASAAVFPSWLFPSTKPKVPLHLVIPSQLLTSVSGSITDFRFTTCARSVIHVDYTIYPRSFSHMSSIVKSTFLIVYFISSVFFILSLLPQMFARCRCSHSRVVRRCLGRGQCAHPGGDIA